MSLMMASRQLVRPRTTLGGLAYRSAFAKGARTRPATCMQHRQFFGVGDPITHASLSACSSILWSVIGANSAVFVAWQYGRGNTPFSNGAQGKVTQFMSNNFVYRPSDIKNGRWWTCLTSAFSQLEINHFVFNMITLHTFSSILIQGFVPPAALAALMLGSALSGSLGTSLNRNDNRGSLGASGMVMGLGAAATCVAPFAKLALFGVVPVPMWLLFAGYTFYDTYYLKDLNSRTGHAAHIGGTAFGLVFYALFLRRLGFF